jgi:dTDP-glucose 4,6-dehydratase
MTILVTGGCGFIGSNFIRFHAKKHPNEKIINVDALTYAAGSVDIDIPNYSLYCADISDHRMMRSIIKHELPRIIYNFAAESHVDNSIRNPLVFAQTNVMGTLSLLEAARVVGNGLRFVHISTDEVYGSLNPHDEPFTIRSQYNPRSPYSASKASSDHFVSAYHHTYGMDTVITNCSNNYGPFQHPEKLIPTIIRKAANEERIPIYGNGSNIRDWIYVDDHCLGVYTAAQLGVSGQKYLFGGENQMANLDIAKMILSIMGKSEDLIEFVEDRKGHDFRYDIDTSESRKLLGWKPEAKFQEALAKTVDWYNSNMEWVYSCLTKHSESF